MMPLVGSLPPGQAAGVWTRGGGAGAMATTAAAATTPGTRSSPTDSTPASAASTAPAVSAGLDHRPAAARASGTTPTASTARYHQAGELPWPRMTATYVPAYAATHAIPPTARYRVRICPLSPRAAAPVGAGVSREHDSIHDRGGSTRALGYATNPRHPPPLAPPAALAAAIMIFNDHRKAQPHDRLRRLTLATRRAARESDHEPAGSDFVRAGPGRIMFSIRSRFVLCRR